MVFVKIFSKKINIYLIELYIYNNNNNNNKYYNYMCNYNYKLLNKYIQLINVITIHL